MKIKRVLKEVARAMQGNTIALLLFILILVIFITGLRDARLSQQKESERIARESILRAAMSCYAIEGAYPATYTYLKDNYTVMIDENKYAVHYEIFASNIMPDISVVKR